MEDKRNSNGLIYYCDTKRHLVCSPYSIANLHKMAQDLDIKRGWFHKNHYDIPKKRIKEMTEKCVVVDSREIVDIIKYDAIPESNGNAVGKQHFAQTQSIYRGTLE